MYQTEIETDLGHLRFCCHVAMRCRLHFFYRNVHTRECDRYIDRVVAVTNDYYGSESVPKSLQIAAKLYEHKTEALLSALRHFVEVCDLHREHWLREMDAVQWLPSDSFDCIVQWLREQRFYRLRAFFPSDAHVKLCARLPYGYMDVQTLPSNVTVALCELDAAILAFTEATVSLDEMYLSSTRVHEVVKNKSAPLEIVSSVSESELKKRTTPSEKNSRHLTLVINSNKKHG